MLFSVFFFFWFTSLSRNVCLQGCQGPQSKEVCLLNDTACVKSMLSRSNFNFTKYLFAYADLDCAQMVLQNTYRDCAEVAIASSSAFLLGVV